MFSRFAGFSNIAVFIAGAKRTGAVAAKRIVEARSSAIPHAAFAIIFAVAGATMTASTS